MYRSADNFSGNWTWLSKQIDHFDTAAYAQEYRSWEVRSASERPHRYPYHLDNWRTYSMRVK